MRRISSELRFFSVTMAYSRAAAGRIVQSCGNARCRSGIVSMMLWVLLLAAGVRMLLFGLLVDSGGTQTAFCW